MTTASIVYCPSATGATGPPSHGNGERLAHLSDWNAVTRQCRAIHADDQIALALSRLDKYLRSALHRSDGGSDLFLR